MFSILMYSINVVLYCIVLCCVVLRCVALRCNVALRCIALHCFVYMYTYIPDILDSFEAGSPQQTQVKLDLWSYDLLNVILVTMKQNFSKVLYGWTTAAKLATVLA